jgi:hypothetical protein
MVIIFEILFLVLRSNPHFDALMDSSNVKMSEFNED